MPVVIRDYMDCEVSSEDKHEDHPCIAWSGLSGKVPVLLFYAETIVSKDGNIRSIGERYNLAFKIVRTESRLVRSILTSHGFHEVHPNSNDFNLMWTGSHLKPYLLRSLQDFQKVNHFPRSYELTRKDRLYKNIQRMQQLHGFKHFHIVPKTFLLPCEYQDFCSWCLKDKGPWIVKPVASSRGRGIYLVSNPNQIPLDENILVSHYISDPLLIDDFKFDLRLYVLVTSYEPLIVYLYEEGLARFATVKYDRSAKNIKNQFMHLTNYSVNKKSSNYVSCDDPEVEDYGNKWSMSAMLRYLKQEGKDTTLLMAQVEDLVIKAVLSAELQIATACKMFVPHRNNCFELYGFDVLIDSNLKPWLLEVNLSPSLACDAPLDLKIKASMISDMFSLVGFVCQDPLLRQTRPGRGPPDSSSRSQARKPQRPMSANEVELNSLKDKLGNNEGNRTLGLTTEELKVLRRTMEEHKRRGGFIRIFPKPETWELYSGYLEYKTSMNCMLAARLFPERSRKSTAALKCGRSTLGSDAPAAADAFHVAQYERKLPSLEARKKKRRRADRRSALARRGTARRCEASNLETKEDEEDSREECDTEGEDVEDEKRDVAHPPAAKTASLGEDLQLDATSRAHGPKVNLLQILREGWDLSKVQARTTFSSYLQRVQMRLLMECRGSGGSAWPEQDDNQMELVIRFLKRATGNLQQEPRMVLPSRRLALADRRRILSYQLGEFIQFYHKETEQMVKKMEQLSEVERCINPDVFQEFVATASESDLEEVLTFYTRKNKSASVFLGTACRSARAEKGDPGRGRRAPADAPESVRAPRQPQTQASRPSATTPAALDCTRVQLHHDWPLVPPEPSQNLLSATEDSAAPTGELPRWGRPVFAPPSTVPVSSVPRAVQIYNQGISRPTSAHPASRKTSPSRPRPDSAVVAKELSPHQVPSPASPHHQAIAVALRRLAEKQATRQYAASSHISLLTQHLTNLNLASGACGSGGVTRNSSLLDTTATTGPLQAIRSESGFVCARKPWLEDDRMSEMDHRGPVTRSPQSWYKLQLATQQLWQQKEQAHQLLEQSRVRRQAILAAQATLPQGLSGATPTLPTALLTWQSQTPAPGASVLGPKPPSSTRDSLIRKTAMQRLNRPVPAEVWASASRGRHVVPEAVCRTAGLSMYRKPFQSQAPKNR